MSLVLPVATALVTVAGMSSVALQLTKLMLYKAAEVGANAAIMLIAQRGDSVGKVQFILMELDVEAKFKSVRSLLVALQTDEVELAAASKDFIEVCVANVREAMDCISETLVRIQNEMDNHAGQWFSSWRSFDVVDDLQLLKAQSRMFDKRLETLINCLSVPHRARSGTDAAAAQQGLYAQRIFGDHGMPGEVSLVDASPESERMKSILMAERALRDVKSKSSGGGAAAASAGSLTGTAPRSAPRIAEGQGQGERSRRSSTAVSSKQTTVLFEDPVFL